MRKVFYHFNTREQENLLSYMELEFRDISENIPELGLKFPSCEKDKEIEALFSDETLYAVGLVTDEKAYLLAKLKYGI